MPPAAHLGPFVLGPRIGGGAHAKVYRGRHASSGHPVALKVLRVADRVSTRALEREAKAVAALSHPGIVQMYDTGLVQDGIEGLTPGARWLAIELATHGALSDHPPRKYATVQQVLQQVLSALGHAHARGVIHRDLKPANVLRSGRTMKLADFGVAWATNEVRRGPRIAGTPAYMAPEQIRGDAERIGPWTDHYAVGCMAWELTTGAPPFAGDEEELLLQHQTDEVPRFEPRIDVPPGFEEWVRRLLGKDPRHRGAHAALIAAELERLDDRSPERAGRSSEGPLPWLPPREEWRLAERSRRPIWLLGTALGPSTLRAVPLVGHFAQRDQLWAGLREVAAHSHPVVLGLHGEPGLGRTALGRWLAQSVREGAHAHVLEIVGDDRSPAAWWAHVAAARDQGPVLVWVDDAEQALAQRWVDQVLDPRVADWPVLLLTTGSASPLGATAIPLRPLPDTKVVQLCRWVAGASPGLGEAVARRVGGVPGDALSLLRGLMADNALVPGPHGFAAPGGLDHLPETGAQRVARVVADAASGVHDLRPVAIAALLQARVGHGTWRRLCEHCGVEANPEAFQPFIAAKLVRWTGRWRFASGAAAEAVLARLPADEDAYLAARIANGLADATVASPDYELQAELMLRAGRPDRALTLACRSSEERTTERTLWVAERARSHLTLDDDDPREVWLDLTRMRLTSRTHGGAELLRKSQARLAPLQGEARSAALPLVARAARVAGRTDVALALIDEALDQEPDADLLRMRSVFLEELGRMNEAEACAYEALTLAREQGRVELLPVLLNNVADWHRVHGRLDEAEEGFRASLEAWDQARDVPVSRAIVLENLALVLGARGDWQSALKYVEDLVSQALESASGNVVRVTFLTTLCLTAASAGRVDLVADAMVRLELEPPWRIEQVGSEGLSHLLLAADRLEDRALARRLRTVVHRASPHLRERAQAIFAHGFFGRPG